MDVKHLITVFTPTYNRANTLSNLFSSLQQQSSKDFEWVIVDDGSSDNTDELVLSFHDVADFPITYVRKKNGGKHTAINDGVFIAHCPWFYIVDSDDMLPCDAISTIITYINQIENDKSYCGVSGQRFWKDGTSAVTGGIAYNVLDSDPLEIRTKYHFIGDMAEVWRTDVLRDYPFPVYEGERFMTEGIVWSRLAQRYKVRYFNANIYMGDRQSDGLVMNIRKHQHNSPKGVMLTAVEYSKDKRRTVWSKVKYAISYWRFSIGKKITVTPELKAPFFFYFFYPAGLIFSIIDHKKYKI